MLACTRIGYGNDTATLAVHQGAPVVTAAVREAHVLHTLGSAEDILARYKNGELFALAQQFPSVATLIHELEQICIAAASKQSHAQFRVFSKAALQAHIHIYNEWDTIVKTPLLLHEVFSRALCIFAKSFIKSVVTCTKYLKQLRPSIILRVVSRFAKITKSLFMHLCFRANAGLRKYKTSIALARAHLGGLVAPFLIDTHGRIWQKKVDLCEERLKAYVKTHDFEKAYALVSQLALLPVEAWKRGVCIADYGMSNIGVDAHDTVVLIDIGLLFHSIEMPETTTAGLRAIQNHLYNALQNLDVNLGEHFLQCTKDQWTTDKVKALWRTEEPKPVFFTLHEDVEKKLLHHIRSHLPARSQPPEPWTIGEGLWGLETIKARFLAYVKDKDSVNVWRLQASIRALPDEQRASMFEWVEHHPNPRPDSWPLETKYGTLSTRARTMIDMPAMELWEALMARFSHDVLGFKYEKRTLRATFFEAAGRCRVVAHGTSNDALSNLCALAKNQLSHHWSLLNIMIEGKLSAGDYDYLCDEYHDPNSLSYSPREYGPYFVILWKRRNAIYAVPHKEGAAFLRAGLQEAVKAGFMTREAAEKQAAKIMTYQEFIDHEKRIPEIIRGDITPAEVIETARKEAELRQRWHMVENVDENHPFCFDGTLEELRVADERFCSARIERNKLGGAVTPACPKAEHYFKQAAEAGALRLVHLRTADIVNFGYHLVKERGLLLAIKKSPFGLTSAVVLRGFAKDERDGSIKNLSGMLVDHMSDDLIYLRRYLNYPPRSRWNLFPAASFFRAIDRSLTGMRSTESTFLKSA